MEKDRGFPISRPKAITRVNSQVKTRKGQNQCKCGMVLMSSLEGGAGEEEEEESLRKEPLESFEREVR